MPIKILVTFSSGYGATKEVCEEIAKIIGADALNYQSPEGLIKSIGLNEDELCMACLTGRYPTPLAQKMANDMKARFEKGHQETGRIYEMASVI